MPKPSLCSSARVAKPVKLNITSVGVFAFRPSSWHMSDASLPPAPRGYSVNSRTSPFTVTRWPGLLVSFSTPLMRRSRRSLFFRSPDQQVGQPRVAVHQVGALVELEARLQCDEPRLERGTDVGVGVPRARPSTTASAARMPVSSALPMPSPLNE